MGFSCSQEEWPLAEGLGVEHHALWDLERDPCSPPTSQMARDDLRATTWSFKSGGGCDLSLQLSCPLSASRLSRLCRTSLFHPTRSGLSVTRPPNL